VNILELYSLGKIPPGTHLTGVWVDTRSRCGRFGKAKNLFVLPEIEHRFIDRLAVGQSCYRLSCRFSHKGS